MSSIQLQKWLTSVAASAYLMAAGIACADDTEIFFNTNYRADTNPNILFVMDTSGSMALQPDESSTEPNTTTPSRLAIVKAALNSLLDSVSDVNVGLARFTVPGGPILLPVRDIDSVDTDVNPVISSTIITGSDDAEQASSGAMSLTDTVLDITPNNVNTEWVGYRFTAIDIPQGATISKAIVSLYSTASNSGTGTIRIYGEASDNPTTFTTATNNISGRAKTTAYATWTLGSTTTTNASTKWNSGARYSTADLSNVIQEIVNRSGWCGGNSIVIMMRREGSSTGKRQARSYEADSSSNTTDFERPQLNVQFSRTLPGSATGCYTRTVAASPAGSTDDVSESGDSPYNMSSGGSVLALVNTAPSKTRAIGIRFPQLRVPQGATIVDSKLTFRNNTGTNWTGTTSVNIQGVAEDNFAGFDVVDAGLTGSGLSKTAAVNVSLPAWNNGVDVSPSSNFNAAVSAVTSRSGWVKGNAFGLVLTYVSGTDKQVSSLEGGFPPVLTVKFQSDKTTWDFTVRQQMKVETNRLFATGSTPLSDTLLEAGLYYRGDDVVYGKNRNGAATRVSYPYASNIIGGSHTTPTGCDPLTDPFNTLCASEALTGTPKYKTPITDTCQSNYIVFLTDGAPTAHNALTETNYTRMNGGGTCSSASSGSDCFTKLAKMYYEKDQSSALSGLQNIKSYFIGFNVDLPLLNTAASYGGTSTSLRATDTSSLTAAFNAILNDIEKRNSTFVSAGVTVNQANRLTHLDQLYFSVFAPDVTPRWAGNLKRYQLGDGGTLLDYNGAVAVDAASDQFLTTARSWWSVVADGNIPQNGGAAFLLSRTRPLYTNIGGNSNVTIVAPGNIVADGNGSITSTMLAVSNATDRTKVLNWASGIDVLDEVGGPDIDGDGVQDGNGVTNEPNLVMGDPLHSRPALVNYYDGSSDGKLRVFVGTNRGELHSIDPDTGIEQWAFVPTDLLSHYDVLMKNDGAVNKPYGLDGSIVPHLVDVNNDGIIKAADGDKAMLYIGMRRGGRNYYAVDVSNPDAPVLKFVITGGSGSYTKLNQTWSQPVIVKAKIKVGTSVEQKTVMIFGGGYEARQDNDTTPVDDTVGNAVFIADADTGALLWSSDDISGLAMNKSVPADVAAIDLNGDGFVDHIYAADMGAQIWRFDFNADGTLSAGATPGPLARFQDTNTEEDNRRFYGGVDVGMIQRDNGSSYVVVAAGSGFREKPLDKEIDEQFYVFRDDGVFTNSITTLDLGDLVDITDLLGDSDTTDNFDSDAIKAMSDAGAAGWYYKFGADGEKSVTAPVIFNNSVLFTTYVPPGPEVENCRGGVGTGRFYALNILDGGPVRDTDGTPLDTDRYQQFTDCPTCGMVPPQLLFTDDDVIGLVGTKGVDIQDLRERVKRIKWRHTQ